MAMVRPLTAVLSVKGPEDPLTQKAVWICWIIAAATMTLGNTVALLQNNLKRLLAYSSIAHAGYLMIGVTVAFANGPQERHGLLRVREHLLLPDRLRDDDPGRIRRHHRAADERPERRDD